MVTSAPILALKPLERSTLCKLRTRIIPIIFGLYVIAYLDRINIGFAALTMNKDLAINSEQFGLLAGIFFFGYFLFEIPSNLLLHKIGARTWLARILITWGIVAILTGFAKTAMHLYVLRFLLGLAEAGYFPGIILYLTYWFPQPKLAYAIAILVTANPVTSIVGAPLSGVILDHIHWFGISSWRWLLILEGFPAIAGGFLTYFLLPSGPGEANFLSLEEKQWLSSELEREKQYKLTTSPISAVRALIHGRVWHLSAAYFMMMVALYAMNFWMPQLIKTVAGQHSNTVVGLLVMIPFLAALPAMILVSRSSDRVLERRYHIVTPGTAGAIALLMLATMTATSAVLSVAIWCLTAISIYSMLGPFWSLPNEFLTGFSAAAGIALINSIGNLGGFAGPYAIGAISHRTGSFQGGLIFASIALFASAALVIVLPKKRLFAA